MVVNPLRLFNIHSMLTSRYSSIAEQSGLKSDFTKFTLPDPEVKLATHEYTIIRIRMKSVREILSEKATPAKIGHAIENANSDDKSKIQGICELLGVRLNDSIVTQEYGPGKVRDRTISTKKLKKIYKINKKISNEINNMLPQKEVDAQKKQKKDIVDAPDYLEKKFENMNLKNKRRGRNRLPKGGVDLSPKHEARKKNKNIISKLMKTESNESLKAFAQMGWSPEVKIQPDQFETLSAISVRFLELAEDVMRVGHGREFTTFQSLCNDSAKSAGKGLVEGMGTGFLSVLKNFIDFVKEKFGKIALITITAICAYYIIKKYWRNSLGKAAILSLGMILTYTGLPYIQEACDFLLTSYTDSIKNLKDNCDEIPMRAFAQNGGVDMSVMSDAITGFLAMLVLPGEMKGKKNTLEIVANIGRSHRGITEAVALVSRSLQGLIDAACSYFEVASFNLITTGVPKVEAWVKETQKLLCDLSSGEHPTNKKAYEKLVDLEQRSYVLMSEYSKNRELGVTNTVWKFLTKITAWMNVLVAKGVCSAKYRPAPVIINFSGESGIGKSALLRPLIALLLAYVLDEDELGKVMADFDAYVYSRQPEHDFWDGYCGQLVCFIDEKDLVHEALLSSANASTDLIRCGNVFLNVLHMAGLEQKGNTYFRSRFVVCTTNETDSMFAAHKAVRYPRAVANRIHLDLRVRVKEEYATEETKDFLPWLRCLDTTKLNKQGYTLNIHDYEVRKLIPVVGSPGMVTYQDSFLNEIISLEEVIRRAGDLYKKFGLAGEQTPENDKLAFEAGLLLKKKHEEEAVGPPKDVIDGQWGPVPDSIDPMHIWKDKSLKAKTEMDMLLNPFKGVVAWSKVTLENFFDPGDDPRASYFGFQCNRMQDILGVFLEPISEEKYKESHATVCPSKEVLFEKGRELMKIEVCDLYCGAFGLDADKWCRTLGMLEYFYGRESLLIGFHEVLAVKFSPKQFLYKLKIWYEFTNLLLEPIEGSNLLLDEHFRTSGNEYIIWDLVFVKLRLLHAELNYQQYNLLEIRMFEQLGRLYEVATNRASNATKQEPMKIDCELFVEKAKMIAKPRSLNAEMMRVRIGVRERREAKTRIPCYFPSFKNVLLSIVGNTPKVEEALKRIETPNTYINSETFKHLYCDEDDDLFLAVEDFRHVVDEEFSVTKCLKALAEDVIIMANEIPKMLAKLAERFSLMVVGMFDGMFVLSDLMSWQAFTVFMAAPIGIYLSKCLYDWFNGDKAENGVPLAMTTYDTNVVDELNEKLAVTEMNMIPFREAAHTIFKNYYTIHYDLKQDRVGYGFFLKPQVFVFNTHYVDYWKSQGFEDEVVILKNRNGRHYTFPINFFYECNSIGPDLSMIYIASVQPHKDISNFIVERGELLKRNIGRLSIMRVEKDVVEIVTGRYTLQNNVSYEGAEKREYVQPKMLVYDIQTRDGDCGMPLILIDPSLRTFRFAGVHVAGTGYCGMGLVFDKDVMNAIKAQLSYIPHTMVKIGEIPRHCGTSGVSSIRQSPLHGKIVPIEKQPARLRPFELDGVRIDPLSSAIARYDRPILTFDEVLVKTCVRAAVLANTSNPHFEPKPRKVSLGIACKGIAGEDFMDSINRGTSPGYPYNMTQTPGYSGKEPFFGKNEEIDFSGPRWPELKRDIEEGEKRLIAGERLDVYYADSLKDELVSKEKARIGKTRLFCPSPLHYTILFSMYFKEFAAKFMKSHLMGEHLVGINVYSIAWEMLFKRMTVFGLNSMIAGDFGSFDASQFAQILEEIGEEIIQLFEDREYDTVRRTLWKEVFNSRHLVGKTILEWLQSLPSGHPLTTIINCIFVGTMFRMCWVRCHDDDLACLREFVKNVILGEYGDDHLASISKIYQDRFNQETIAKYMADFGMIYTSEDKTSDVKPIRSIYDVEFLKRKFRFEPLLQRHVAPLRLTTILEMPCWSKKKQYDTIWRDNVDNALRELSLHDKTVYDEFAPKILEAASNAGYYPLIVDRTALLFETVKREVLYGSKAQMCVDILPQPVIKLGSSELWCSYKNFPLKQRNTNCLELVTDLIFEFTIPRMGHKVYPGKRGSCVDVNVYTTQIIPRAATENINMIDTTESVNDPNVGSTHFINDASTSSATRNHQVGFTDGLMKGMNIGYEQSNLLEFLQKPILANTLVWSTQVDGSVLYTNTILSWCFGTTVFAPKIVGFKGIRADARIRVQVNGNRFQQGRLMLVYVPQGETLDYATRISSLVKATQLPRVELDLSQQTEMEMLIPYISPYAFYNFRDNEDNIGEIGTYHIIVYSRLDEGAGSASADVNVWVNLENIQLKIPAVQMSTSQRPSGLKSERSGVDSGINPTIIGGPKMGKAAASMMLTSSLLGLPNWATNVITGAAVALGYSKPTDTSIQQRLAVMGPNNMQNCSGSDIFPVMGLESQNEIAKMPSFAGVDVDEMSLLHLCSIPAYVATLVWTADAPVDTSLTFFKVSPIFGQTQAANSAGVIVSQLPVGYFSNFFRYWRGGFVLTVKLVKTQFHSGRLQITYNPWGTQKSIYESSFLLREIIDIRDTNEFKFRIPFISEKQYLDRGATDGIGCEDMGIIQIRVLNRLVRPDSVADHVEMILEWSAAEDFEVMGPRSHNMLPVIQMDVSQTPVGSVSKISKDIGTSRVDSSSIEPAAYCVGEKIQSILQLGKRFSRTSNALFATTASAFASVRPFTIFRVGVGQTMPLPVEVIGCDTYSLLASCFAYSTGSMRLLVPIAGNVPVPSDVVMSIDFNSNTLRSVNNAGNNLNQIGASVNYPTANQIAPVRGMNIPAYQKTPFRINVYETGSGLAGQSGATSDVLATFRYSNTTTAAKGPLYRAMGDDAALGFFIGCPQIAVTTGGY